MPEMAPGSLDKLHVTTDVLHGKQVTFDYPQEDITSIISHEQLIGSPIQSRVNGYAIVGAQIDTQGSPGNVLIDGAPALDTGVNHWRFVGVPESKGGFGCGMSSVAGFGSGWGMKAFYLTSNGNLAGRGALRVGFVSHMPKLPTVDWILEVSDDNVVDAYLYVNNEFRGHAGHLQFPDRDSIKALRPALTFDDSSENCRAVYISHDIVPVNPDADYKKLPQPSSIYDCKWVMTEPQLVPDPFHIILSMMPQGISVKVANSMHIGAKVGDDGSIQVSGAVTSTMMMPPEPLRPVEKEMSEMLRSLTKWNLEDDTLTLTSSQGAYKFTIYRDGPVTENPLA